jgi:hypothetical protein
LFSHWLIVAWKTEGTLLDCDDSPVRPCLNRQFHQLGTKFGGRDPFSPPLNAINGKRHSVRAYLKVRIQPALGIANVIVFLNRGLPDPSAESIVWRGTLQQYRSEHQAREQSHSSLKHRVSIAP